MVFKTEEETTKLKFRMINSLIKKLSKELMTLKIYTNKLETEVRKKVNLESEIFDNESTKNHILTGTISSNGINITGVNTLFTKELTLGYKINISNESKVITGITDDTHATVESPGFSTYSNQLATITKPVTREELLGEFNFGNLSTPFNGTINKGSSLKHYGDMVDLADVVNVGFVLKSTNAALQRAAQAIQRDGDTVGDDTGDQLNYLFQNVKMIFNDSSILKYSGQYSEPDDVVTKGVIDNLKSYIDIFKDDTFYASWGESNENQMRNVTSGSIAYYTQLGLTPTEKTSSFDNYFTVTTNGLVCKKACVILICVNAWQNEADARAHGADGTGLYLYFTKNDILLSKLVTKISVSDAHGASAIPGLGGSFIINCTPSDIIKCGPGYLAHTGTLHVTTSITKMR